MKTIMDLLDHYKIPVRKVLDNEYTPPKLSKSLIDINKKKSKSAYFDRDQKVVSLNNHKKNKAKRSKRKHKQLSRKKNRRK